MNSGGPLGREVWQRQPLCELPRGLVSSAQGGLTPTSPTLAR